MRLLLVEDDPMIGASVQRGLRQEGHTVDWVRDGVSAEAALSSAVHEMLLLDLGLPDKSGLDLLAGLRRRGSDLPVLVITARDSVADRVTGLDAGADDYLVKPFSFQELEARIKALLRRSGNESVHMALRCGDLVLDPPSHRAIRNGQVIDLTVKEYRLLEYFIQNQGTALSRMNLLKNVWDKDFDTNTNVVDVYVNYLRTKIDKDFEPKLIHTVVGVGYMMEA